MKLTKKLAALGAAAVLGLGMSLVAPMSAHAADLKVSITGPLTIGKPNNVTVTGCDAPKTSLVVDVTSESDVRNLTVPAARAVTWHWSAPSSGVWTIKATCLSYSGSEGSQGSATVTIVKQSAADVVCVGTTIKLMGEGATPGASLNGWLTSEDAFYEEGLFYATKLGPVTTVAQDGSFTWVLQVPSKVVQYKYVAAVGEGDGKNLQTYTFAVKSCGSGNLPKTGA